MSESTPETPAMDDTTEGDDFVGDEVEPEHDVDIDAMEDEDDE